MKGQHLPVWKVTQNELFVYEVMKWEEVHIDANFTLISAGFDHASKLNFTLRSTSLPTATFQGGIVDLKLISACSRMMNVMKNIDFMAQILVFYTICTSFVLPW